MRLLQKVVNVLKKGQYFYLMNFFVLTVVVGIAEETAGYCRVFSYQPEIPNCLKEYKKKK